MPSAPSTAQPAPARVVATIPGAARSTSTATTARPVRATLRQGRVVGRRRRHDQRAQPSVQQQVQERAVSQRAVDGTEH